MKTATDKKPNNAVLAPVLKSIIFVFWVINMQKSIRRKVQSINWSALFFALLITSSLYVTADRTKPSIGGDLKINTLIINQVVSF